MSEADASKLFDELVAKHGPLDRLGSLDREMCTIIVRMMITMRSAASDEIARLAATVATLTATLPTPITADASPEWDLTKLTDEQLNALMVLEGIATGTAPVEPLPPMTERVMGRNETLAASLGRYIDDNAPRWRHGGPSEDEQLELRNRLVEIGDGFIVRNLWRSIHKAETEALITEAVRKALAAVGSDARIVPPDDPKQLGSIHDHPLALLKNGPYT
jgi:hypothetical protein